MSIKDELRRPKPRRRTTVIGGVLALGAVSMAAISARTPSEVRSAANHAHAQASIGVPSGTPNTAAPLRTTIETERASGSILGIGWRTANVTVTAGRSVATVTAVGVGAGGHTSDSEDAPCLDLMTSHAQHSSDPRDPTLMIDTTNDMTATVQVRDPGDRPTQTITVVLATCPDLSP